jgi:phenylpyruvate tautomerase PptA (4-oxalocrotonate tautomerase family)
MQVSNRINGEDKHVLQAKVTEVVARIMKKPASAIMVSIHEQCDLYMDGQVLESGLYMEVRAFGPSTSSVKEMITLELNKVLKSVLKISEQHIYITFEDKMQWGFKGGYLEK